MKTTFLSALFLFGAIAANAQFGFGFQAGGTGSLLREKSAGEESHSEMKAGFLLGAVANTNLGGGFGFRPELNFVRKGGQNEFAATNSGVTIEAEQETSLSYIQLLPMFVYNMPSGKSNFFIGLGPEIAAGIGGKYEATTKTIVNFNNQVFTTTDTQKGDVNFDSDGGVGNLKRFDFGAAATAGYRFANGLFISLGYNHGFSNIQPNGDEDNSVKNRSANLKIGFMIK